MDYGFLSGLLCGLIAGWGVRLSLGRLVIREEGRWQFRLCRFDEAEQEVVDRVKNALEIGHLDGWARAWREWKASGRVTSPYEGEPPV